jgi:hypothetical protein
MILEFGMAELVDTLTHEGYHALLRQENIFMDTLPQETNAWNHGLKMSNEYRMQNNENIPRTIPYTWREIYDKGYRN